MNFNQKFKFNKFFGQLDIFKCSFCLDICDDPVLNSKTQQIVCLKHQRRSQFKRGTQLNYLYCQIKIQCETCHKEKNYHSYHRHKAKCLDRSINSQYIINFYNFMNEKDQEILTCQQCGKIDIRLFNCCICQKSKCMNCKISDQDCCSKSLNRLFDVDIHKIQLQCKAEFCQEIVNAVDLLKHYEVCNYRLKQCRIKLCNWEGFKINYQNHECKKNSDFHLNQCHQTKYNQIIDIKKQNRISQLQQKTNRKIKLLNKMLQNLNEI